MSTVKPQYAAAASITITLNSLSNGSARQSTVVDNTSNLYEDALVSVTIQPGTSPTAGLTVSVYAYSIGDGSNYTDGATGSDAAYTLFTSPNLRLLGNFALQGSTTAYSSPEYSVAQLFGAILPSKWGIVCVNNLGVTLASSGNTASYVGVNRTIS